MTIPAKPDNEPGHTVEQRMRRRDLIHGCLLSLIGIVTMIDVWVRRGFFHVRGLDFWNSAKERRDALEMYAGLILLFLGLWWTRRGNSSKVDR